MLLIRSVAVIRLGSAHNLRRAESWRANSSPGARETCGGARGRALALPCYVLEVGGQESLGRSTG
jgi:hypothetical protein